MFRIAFMVEDKKLSEVLRRLTGFVINMEPPQLVRMSEATTTDSLGRRIPDRKKAWDQFPLPKVGTELNVAAIAHLCGQFGISPSSVQYAIQNPLKRRLKLVRRSQGHDGGSTYRVIK